MRIVIADDTMLIREGTARLLEDAGFEIVGKADDAPKLLRAVALDHPDVAIVDIKVPPTHTDEGLVAAEQIRAAHPQVGVLVLSQYLESRYATRLLEHHPEAVGYLLKERVSDIAVLADAIHRINEGECVLDPTIVARLIRRPRRQGPLDELTGREREVLSPSSSRAGPIRPSPTSWCSAPRPSRPTLAGYSQSSAWMRARTTTAASSRCWPSSAPEP
jgi:DNA-binding NarL/FixJ family response regulator